MAQINEAVVRDAVREIVAQLMASGAVAAEPKATVFPTNGSSPMTVR